MGKIDKNREIYEVHTVSVNFLHQSHTPVCRYALKLKKGKRTHIQTRR